MSDMELFVKGWPVVVSVFAVIIWNIRLEAKVVYLEKDYIRHQQSLAEKDKEITEKDKALWTKFDSLQTTVMTVLQMLTRLETKIEMKQKE